MRFTIDTELERIIVPDNFFNQIDKMNAVLEANNAGDRKTDYVCLTHGGEAEHDQFQALHRAAAQARPRRLRVQRPSV